MLDKQGRDNRPEGRPYKWDVLAKAPIGTNRELWLERRWQTGTPGEKPHYMFVAVTTAVTDMGVKLSYKDVTETMMFSKDALELLLEAIEKGLDKLDALEKSED